MPKSQPQTLSLKSERGQALTEFALVLPIIALILFGIAQFGVVFNNYLTLTDAVRAGARKAAVSRLEPCPTCKAEEAVRNAAGDLPGDLQVTVTPAPWAPASDVTVQADYPYNIDLLGVVLKTGRISSSTTERVE
jgi:Flp pilus assembly protein TadG